MNHFSLFTGIGGLDLAAEWAGFETVGQCEFADYPTKVLEKHWSQVPRWRDVRDVTAESIHSKGIKGVDILSGGFPCQPHSLAGKCRGSDDERDLWGEFARICGEVRPKWLVGENVAGLLHSNSGRFFGRILNDMAQMGYYVGWSSYGANSVGANHYRERVFIVAYDAYTYGTSNNKYVEISRIIGRGQKSQGLRSTHWQQYELDNSKVAPSKWRKKGQVNSRPLLLRDDDGVPGRMDRLKCLGNAVVPQQAYPIFKAIMEIERGK